MRLWSLSPEYLDSKGLVALWREGLLAQKVLTGKTAGYINHPQLIRFRSSSDPLGAIASYLRAVAREADERGYSFNKRKIGGKNLNSKVKVTSGQIAYEYRLLLKKLKDRDNDKYKKLLLNDEVAAHPLFEIVDGEIESWERF